MTGPIWHGDEQGSVGWLMARCGLLTASRMADAMSFQKSGKESEARKKYKIELVAERITGIMTSRHVNDAMRWGIEQEKAGKELYEEITGNIIIPCGFAIHGDIHEFGASPDGLVGDDGLVEVKCPTTETFITWVMEGEVPEQHKPQMTAQLAVTRRVWCDFFAYDPRVSTGNKYFLRRFIPSREDIEALEAAAKTFLNEVNELFEKVTMGGAA